MAKKRPRRSTGSPPPPTPPPPIPPSPKSVGNGRGRDWAIFALILNLVGTGLLYASFQAKASDFRFITAPDTDTSGASAIGNTAYAICVKSYTVVVTDASGTMGMGLNRCPEWATGQPAAIVIFDHPLLGDTGLVCFVLGFAIQALVLFRERRNV